MSLSQSERKEIEEIVRAVFVQEFKRVTTEITHGFVEAIDWYTDNIAKIMLQSNEKNEVWAADMREKMSRMVAEPIQKKIEGFK